MYIPYLSYLLALTSQIKIIAISEKRYHLESNCFIEDKCGKSSLLVGKEIMLKTLQNTVHTVPVLETHKLDKYHLLRITSKDIMTTNLLAIMQSHLCERQKDIFNVGFHIHMSALKLPMKIGH